MTYYCYISICPCCWCPCPWIISVAHIWADVVNLWRFRATREAPKNDAVISNRSENWGLYMTGQIAWFVCCFWSVHSPVALLICVWTLPMGPIAQGSAIDSFSLNSSYFLAKGVPVLGALFNLGVAWHLRLTAETLGTGSRDFLHHLPRSLCWTCLKCKTMFVQQAVQFCTEFSHQSSLTQCKETEGFYSWEKCQESIGAWFTQPLICQGWKFDLWVFGHHSG